MENKQQSSKQVKHSLADKTKIRTISVYVANKPGVLSRISMVFSRRGFNIESLVVSSAKESDYSRITITVYGSISELVPVIKQMEKLIDVIKAVDHTTDAVILYEMILIKISISNDQERSMILQLIEHYKARTLNFTNNSLIIHLSGKPSKINSFIALLDSFNVVELIRTGNVVMSHSTEPT